MSASDISRLRNALQSAEKRVDLLRQQLATLLSEDTGNSSEDISDPEEVEPTTKFD